jgi:hypothetical protein
MTLAPRSLLIPTGTTANIFGFVIGSRQAACAAAELMLLRQMRARLARLGRGILFNPAAIKQRDRLQLTGDSKPAVHVIYFLREMRQQFLIDARVIQFARNGWSAR